MATTWGPWVRVSGEGLDLTYAGVLTAVLWGHTDVHVPQDPWPYEFGNYLTPSGGVYADALGARAYIQIDRTSVTSQTVSVRASAGEEVDVGAEWDSFIGYNWHPENPMDEPGPNSVSVSYTISATGMVLARRHGINKPDKRQHMHPRDAHLEDAWFMCAGTVITVTASGGGGTASASTGALRTWSAYAGQTDEEIGLVQFDSRLALSFRAITGMEGTGGITIPSATVATASADCNYGGIRATMAGGDSGDSEITSQVVTGADGTLSHYDDRSMSPIASVHGYGVTVKASPPARWVWDLKFSKFDHEDPAQDLDPLIDAGYLTADGAGGGTRALFLASELPELIPRHDIEVLPGKCDHRVPLAAGTVYHPGGTLSAHIDEGWALGASAGSEHLCPGAVRETDYLIEATDDRYCVLECPGVNAGVGISSYQQWPHTPYTITAKDSPLFPIAEDKDAPNALPEARFVQTGDLPSLRDPLVPLRWHFPASLYEAEEFPGGSVRLAIQTRYWDRLALLPQLNVDDKNWRWPWKTLQCKRDEKLDGTHEPIYGEDVYSWKDYSFLRLRFYKPKWLDLRLRLEVVFSGEVTVTDPHYTCGSYRAEDYDYTVLEAKTVHYTFRVPAATTDLYYTDELGRSLPTHDFADAVIDLLCPDDGTTPYLFVLDSMAIEGLSIPRNHRPDKPEDYVEGGYLEWVHEGSDLTHDLGYDHTGRDTRGNLAGPNKPSLLFSAKESWDFHGDWEGACIERDGNLRGLDLRDEPARNDGPEQGTGYIEPLEHCPTNPLDFSLDYARPLGHLKVLELQQGYAVEEDQGQLDAMLKSFWKGQDDPEVLTGGFFYWFGDNERVAPEQSSSQTELKPPVAVRVSTWQLAPGPDYTLRVRKCLGGRARSFVKQRTGRGRATGQWLADQRIHEPWYVIWVRSRYENCAREAIAAPAGYPTAGEWRWFADGAATINEHGLFETPSLSPSRSRIPTGKGSGTPYEQTDVQVLEYHAVLWANKEYATYDPRPGAHRELRDAAFELMRNDADYLLDMPLGEDVTGHMWTRTGQVRTTPARNPYPRTCVACACHPSRGGLHRAGDSRAPQGPPTADIAGRSGAASVDQRTGSIQHSPGEAVEVRGSAPVPFECVWRNDLAVSQAGSPGLAPGWAHNWDLTLHPAGSTSTVWNDLNLTWPNGAKQKLSPVLDEQGDPTGDFETPAGVTYLVSGTPAATLGGWDLVTVTWGCDSTKGCETMWRFEPHESGCYAITARAESSGQAVSFTWANDRRLLGAARDDGAPLYTLTYDANDRLSTVVDVTGRVVSYTFATEVDGSLPRLTEVSDLAPVGETPSRWAWRYNYQMVPPMTGVETVVLMREAIRPGPVDGAHVTATFSYQDHGYVVSELQQPTGERRSFWYEDGYTLDTLVGANARYEQHWNTSFDANGEVVTSTWQGGAEYGYGDPAQPQKPTAITDASGAKTTYTYDAQGNVTSVCDPRGILTTFAYEQCSAGFGKLKTQVRGDTVLVSNSYDVAGRLLAKQDALGGITSFTYDDHDNVQSVTDPLGSITTTLYDEHDQLVTRINPLGAIWTYVYDDRGSLTSEMNPLGAQTQYEYDLAGREIARVDALSHRWTVTRGPSGLALSVTDPMGAITTNVYDGQGRVIGTVDALGRETHATFDAFGNQVGEIDALGRGTASLHDDWSKPVGEQDAQGNVTTLVYDDTFQLTAFAGPMGSITTVLHDAAGRGVAEVNILGQITTRVFDEAGRKAAMIDPLGQVTSYHYDIMDRIVAIEDPLGQRTTTVYDGAGRPEATINALGQISTVVYDAAGQVIASINPLGYRTTTVYDLAGRTVSVTNPLGETHATEYDALNRVVAQVDPLGLRTTVFYDATGQPVATMDAAGCLSTTTYDIVGRAVASVDECGNVTQYVYDAGDRRTAVVDPNGHAWRTVYDLDDNVIGQVDPLGAATATNYDALGRPTVEYDARGWATTTTYDALGRTSSQLYVDGSGVSYAYDALGRVAAVTNPTGTTTHTYDALSRMTSVLYPTGKALTYSYDPLSRRVGMVDHDGGLSTYTYDAGGRLVSQVNPFGEVTTYTHDPLGRTETKILGNGAWAEHDYDPAGRPTALHWRNSTGDTLAAYDAAYDAVGNRVAVTELDGTFQYRYDATGQLLAEQRVGANAYLTTYTYDGAGNRVLEERDSGLAVLYTYNDADELLAVDEMLPAATVLRPFESLLAAPYSASANALRLALPTGSTCTLTHASVYLVGGQGDWNGTNCWTLSVDALGADLAPVTHLASGGIVGAGPAVLQIAIAEEAQALDPSVTPYVGVSLQCVGSAPALLAATGTVALLSDDEEPETLAALRSVVQTPLDTDAASLALPLAAGHAFRLEEATVGVTGAAGDWGSANQWLLKVNSGGGLASARVLSSAVLDEAAAQTLTLPGSTRLFNTSLSPLLTLSADARGNAPELLSLQATARLKAWRLANSVTFTYDPNGSVISEVTDEEVLTYAWDPSDRLVGVARDADPVAAYAYDAGGRRVAATTDAGTTNYLWDEQNLLAELDEALDTLAQYTDYPGVWGGLSSVHAGGASAFFAPDLSSNIRLLLTAAQGVEQASLYGAFGVPLAGATASPLGFGGGLGYFDDGLDRLYVRARHYRPGLGAWMSRDPLRGFLGGYGYVGNSPVGWVDPSGWQAEGYEAEGYLNDALNPTGSEPDPDGKHIAERWADAKEAVSSGLATDARALAGTDPWVAGSLTVDGTALAIEGNRGSLRPAILARDEQQARAAAAAKRVADSDKARRRLEQARNVARNRGRRVKTAAGDYARAEREHRLASDALRGSCSAAASEAAEAASKRGLLETILRQLAKLKEALINGSMRIEELLKAFTKLEPLLNLVGAIIAVRDLYVSIRDFKSCQLKGARCTPKVCGAPVVTALVEAITAVPLLFPPVALNPAFSVPLVVGNLVATGTGAVVQWVWSECFS